MDQEEQEFRRQVHRFDVRALRTWGWILVFGVLGWVVLFATSLSPKGHSGGGRRYGTHHSH
jgi:hypothetical protein